MQLNPQHTLPTLIDDDFILWDSHAISTYLIEKYAPNDRLYPKDVQQRARVNQRLHFDSGVLFAPLYIANYDVYNGAVEPLPEHIDALHTGLEFLEKFLTDSPYLVGDELTLADLSCLCTVACMQIHFSIDAERYPNVTAWMDRLSELPYYEKLCAEPTRTHRRLYGELKEANAVAKEAA